MSYYHTQKNINVSECIVSDNAPEYRKISKKEHALCWIHDARNYKKLNPFNNSYRKILDNYMDKYWSYYHDLLDYKSNPSLELSIKLEADFDELFSRKTSYEALNEKIIKTSKDKDKLLTVLRHPEIPLHNNLAELGARKQVRKRDISLHTMSDEGTRNQDAFMSIVQTAIQLGVNVFEYIKELISGKKDRISLADIILDKIYPNTS